MTGEEAPQAGAALRQAVCCTQPDMDFRQGEVGFGLDQIQQPIFVDLHGR